MNERRTQISQFSEAEKIPYQARELSRKIRQLEQCLDKAANYSALSKTLKEITKCKKKLEEELKKISSFILFFYTSYCYF